jgi:hypothetical protein
MMIIAADLSGYFQEYGHFPKLSIQGHKLLPQRTWREELRLLYPSNNELNSLDHQCFQCPLFMSNRNYLDSVNNKEITNFLAIQLPFSDKNDTVVLFVIAHTSQILSLTTLDITYSEWSEFYDTGLRENIAYLEHQEVMVCTEKPQVYFLSNKAFKKAVDSSDSTFDFLKKVERFSKRETRSIELIQLIKDLVPYLLLVNLILIWIVSPCACPRCSKPVK